MKQLLSVLFMLIAIAQAPLEAACVGILRTWTGGSNNSWTQTGNWSGANVPDTSGEDVVIPSAVKNPKLNASPSIGCFEVTDGLFENGAGGTARTLTVNGDYFRALNPGTILLAANHPTTIAMAASIPQQLSVVDAVNFVNIAGNSTVTFTESFEIRNNLTFTGATAGTLRIDGTLNLSFATVFTIPSGITVEVSSGASLIAAGGITVNGSLIVRAGGSVRLGSGTSLTVASGALLELDGASGNVATVSGNGSVTYNMTINGTLSANYFRIDRVDTAADGLVINGTASSLSNGEVHYVPSGGYAITLGASASVPTTWNNMGFFDDSGFGNNGAVDASAYTGSVITLNNWSGLGCAVEGCADELDPGNKLTWGAQAGTLLTLSTNTNSGKPVSPVTAGAAADEMVIFSFNLNQLSANTDITSVKFTLTGTGSASDVDYIQVFDQGASCQTLGAQIGSNLTMSGTPATATVSIPASTVSTNGSAPACIHVYLKTTTNAQNAMTLGLQIAGSNDVVNSAGYSFSGASGPPVSSAQVTINGDPTRIWSGNNSTSWTQNNNWLNGNAPDTTVNCRIGSGTNTLALIANRGCQNLTLTTGGAISFSGGAHTLTSAGALEVQSGYTFTNAASGTLAMEGTGNQTIQVLTTFPGNLSINNTGVDGNNSVSTLGNVTITGSLNVLDGVFKIGQGHTVTVGGNVTVSSGATLDIEPGGILKLGNNSVVTINAGGVLEMVGNGQQATMNATAPNAFTVVVNGTIKASNYTFSNLGTNGVTINSGATIDGTHYLQSGSFSYPQNNNSTFLRLNRTIPGNTLSNMSFDAGGSGATGITNILTNVSPASGTNLAITSFSGSWGGSAYSNETGYAIDWSGESNTFTITVQASAPANVNQGTTGVVMGRFAFQQAAGVVFNDMTITALKLTLTGTGSSNDIDNVKIFNDTDCDSAAGTQIGSGTLSGSPATINFTGLSVVVQAGASPPTRCIYVTADINANANNSKTIGFQLKENVDITNNQNYTIDATTSPPRNLGNSTIVGSSTTWSGGTSTDWYNSANWTGGVPTYSLNCNINSATFAPTIASGTANCKSLTINTGSLTISSGATLSLRGSLSNNATMTNNGTVEFTDDGTSSLSQTIVFSAGTLGAVRLSGTASAISTLAHGATSSLTMTSLTYGASAKHRLNVNNGKTLILSSGATISAGNLTVLSGGTVKVAAGQTITVSGGTFSLNGTEQAHPQTLSTKAKVTVEGAGTWGLNSTSGIIYLGGFQIDYIDTNGIRVNGTTNLVRLAGGQFTNLSNSYSSVRAIQISTTGTVVTTAPNVGWNWSPNNTYPANTETYQLVYTSGSGCSNGTIDFTGWFGDWYENTATFNVATKTTSTACTVNMAASASPVSLTAFTATPYNGKVDLNWETALEQNHYGFNVYRANQYGTEFIQINNRLVRNLTTNSSYRGKYRFIDENVTNGTIYYYYLEDIGTDGFHTEVHGPVSATPLAGLGNPPATGASVNDGTNPDDGLADAVSGSTIPNPSFRDLGNGVVILAQTSSSLRLWITPPALSYTPAAWDNSYETLTMNGYSRMLDENKPELLERVVLIEVNPWVTTVALDKKTETYTPAAGHKISPAPTWSLNGSQEWQSSYTPDAATYANNSYLPAEFATVDPDLVSIGSKKYLKVIINPVKFNAAQEIVRVLDEMVLDISLTGNSWEITPPQNDFTLRPEIVSNTLKIYYEEEGMYELTYDSLVDSNVEGPFVDVAVSDLRLYYSGNEIPLEINSADAIFNSGDSIRFFAGYRSMLEDKKNVVVLSPEELITSGQSPKRMESIDANPVGYTDYAPSTVTFITSKEENNLAYFQNAWAEGLDHFFHARIFAPYPSTPALEYKDIYLEMYNVDNRPGEFVKVSAYLKGAAGNNSYLMYRHHVGIYINNIATMLDSAEWLGDELVRVDFTLPAEYFFPGNNKIRLKSLGTYVTAPDTDTIYIDKVTASYPGLREARNNLSIFRNNGKYKLVDVTNFSSNSVLIYDISDVDYTSKLSSAQVTTSDGGVSYDVRFATVPNAQDNLTRRYWVGTSTKFKTPVMLELTYGNDFTLMDTDNEADYLIIGPSKLLRVTDDYVDHKESQDLIVKTISLEQIYAEFNNASVSSAAIKDFILYTQNSWAKAPKYVLFLGDGTYDPKDHYEYENPSTFWPAPLVKGRFIDFGSDNWFVVNYEGTPSPKLAVGRLPSDDPAVISTYLSKVIDYESEDNWPSSPKAITFISDKDTSDAEGFEAKNASLATLAALSDNGLSTSQILRSSYTNAAMKSAFSSAFSSAPLIINFLGHGAENIMADNAVFNNTDASGLSNSKYPIMVTLNCLNAAYYDPDTSVETIGEKLIFNNSGGAIAFIGSTTTTTPHAQMGWANQFYTNLGEELGQAAHTVRLGDLFNSAKTALAGNNYYTDVLQSYSLFGDPTLVIPDTAFTAKAPPAAIPTPFTSAKPVAQTSSSGGCSLMAADGRSTLPWYLGILELLTLALIFIGLRWSVKRIKF